MVRKLFISVLLVIILLLLIGINTYSQPGRLGGMGQRFIATDSVWTSASTPASNQNAGGPITAGIVFSISTPGYLTHIRFYKTTTSTTTYTLALWSSAGTLLGSATLSNSATGWQRVALTNPIGLAASTTYVVSQSNATGLYGETTGIFTSGLTSGIITCPSQATSSLGCNACGVTSANTFPNGNFASNTSYWVQPVIATR